MFYKRNWFLLSMSLLAQAVAVTTLTVTVGGDAGANDVGTLVGTTGDLRGILNFINLNNAGPYSVVFNIPSGGETVTLGKPLPVLNLNAINAITVDGSNTLGSGKQITLSGNSLYRGFLVRQANTANPVTIQNMTLMNCKAIGGNGGAPAGGGGMGAGGGIFADSAVSGTSSMILANVTFNGCGVMGGNGAAGTATANTSGGGGGGMGGNGGAGGAGGTGAGGGGGGGLFGVGGNGGSTTGAVAGGGGGGGGALGAGGNGSAAAANAGGAGGGGGATVSATGGTGATNTPGAATVGGSSGIIPTTMAGNFVAGGGGGGGEGNAGGTPAAGGGTGGGATGGVSGGGGGGGSIGSAGTTSTTAAGGAGGNGGGGGGGFTGAGGAGGNGGGGGGALNTAVGGAGGYGGGSGGCVTVTNTAVAGFGGGGGATGNNAAITGGAGGYGGGGAGAGQTGATTAGAGGLGGGGGGGNSTGTSAIGGQGGGNGGTVSPKGGGTGAALGGAMFVAGSGALEIRGQVTTTGSTATVGTAADSSAGVGTAAATDIFVQTGTSLVFNPINATDSITISGTIGDNATGTLPGSGTVGAGTGTGAAVVKNGLGTAILSGTNTWGQTGGTGSLTINAGTVQTNSASSLGNMGNTLLFAGNGTKSIVASYTTTRAITINTGVLGTWSVSSGVTFTFNGSVSGGGALGIAGLGTVLMGGASNSYLGGTQISGGVTQINATSNLGSGGVTFSGNGTLQFGAATTYRFPSVVLSSGGTGTLDAQSLATILTSPISGPGNLNVVSSSGGGSVTLSGTNTYSGQTVVNTGSTLLAGAAGSFSPNSQFNVAGGTVSLNGMNQTIGSLTGNGGTVSLGSNTLTMGNDNSSPSAFGGTISGTGGNVVKVGSGTIGLSGANSYTGSTTVNGGRLNILGALTSPVTVASGGTLGGTGLITGAVTINSGGSLTPGTSIGTMSIAGALTIQSGATTNIEINPTNSSILAVTGSASIGGTVNVIVDSGSYATMVYPFLTASNGISGTFSGLTFTGSLPSGFVGFLSYAPGTVNLNITVPPSFNKGGLKGNALHVGNALEAFSGNSAYTSLLATLFSLPSGELQAALNSISPARNFMNAFVTMNGMYSFATMTVSRMSLQRSLDRLSRSQQESMARMFFTPEELTASNHPAGSAKKAAKNCRERDCFWVEGLGDWASQSGQNQMPKTGFNTRGLFLGFDAFHQETGMFGIAAGYARTSMLFHNNQGTGTINSWIFGPYGTVEVDDIFFEFGLYASANQNRDVRNIAFPGFQTMAHNKHWSFELAPHFALGADFGDEWIFEPFVSADLVVDLEKGYTETGAGLLNMSVDREWLEMLRTEAGVRAYQMLDECWGTCVLRESAAYVNKAPFGSTKNLTVAFVGSPSSFTVDAFTQSQNLLTLGLELLVKGNNGVFGSASYDGEFFSGYVSNQAQVTAGIYF